MCMHPPWHDWWRKRSFLQKPDRCCWQGSQGRQAPNPWRLQHWSWQGPCHIWRCLRQIWWRQQELKWWSPTEFLHPKVPCITNTYFYHPHLLDHILTHNKSESKILSTKAIRGPESFTDHYMVCLHVRLILVLPRRKWPPISLTKKINVRRLKEIGLLQGLATTITEALQAKGAKNMDTAVDVEHS